MLVPRALFQYPIRHLIFRSREVSKLRDLYLELSDRSEIWQAPRQHCCRSACQISKRCKNSKLRISRLRDFSRDLTIRHLIRYWNGAQGAVYSTAAIENPVMRDRRKFANRTKKDQNCNSYRGDDNCMSYLSNGIMHLGQYWFRWWQGTIDKIVGLFWIIKDFF